MSPAARPADQSPRGECSSVQCQRDSSVSAATPLRWHHLHNHHHRHQQHHHHHLRCCLPGRPQLPYRSRTRRVPLAVAAAAAAVVPLPSIPLEKLLLVAAAPVVKVALYASVGALCARKGLMTADGRRVISTLVFWVFSPCLFFNKLGNTCSIADVARLWPVSANILLTLALGFVLGVVLVRVTQPPKHWRNLLVLTTTLGNTNNLPIVLVSSIAGDPSLAHLMGRAAAAASGLSIPDLGISYVMLGGLFSSFAQYPLALSLLKKADEDSSEGAPVKKNDWLSRCRQAVQLFWANFLTPPTVACLAAVAVASLPPLRAALFSGDGAQLQLVGQVVAELGALAVPCLFLVLGANLAEGPGVSTMPFRHILGAVVCRLLLLPLTGTAVVLSAYRAGALGPLDPLLLLVLLVTNATPTAVLVHSIATMQRNGEGEVSVLLFWQYLASVVTIPIVIALQLMLVVRCLG